MEVYERIKYVRKKELNMTQEEFGQALGVSRSVIANIEYNRLARLEQKEPIIKLICKQFHINESWLRTGEGEPFAYDLEEDEFSNYVAEIDRNDPRLKQAILYYKKLSEKDKKLFWDFVDRFVLKKEPED